MREHIFETEEKQVNRVGKEQKAVTMTVDFRAEVWGEIVFTSLIIEIPLNTESVIYSRKTLQILLWPCNLLGSSTLHPSYFEVIIQDLNWEKIEN